VRHRAELTAIVESAIAAITWSELVTRLAAARTAYGAQSTTSPASRTIHSSGGHRAMTPHGPVDMPAPVVICDNWQPAWGSVPSLGAHTDALRKEFA